MPSPKSTAGRDDRDDGFFLGGMVVYGAIAPGGKGHDFNHMAPRGEKVGGASSRSSRSTTPMIVNRLFKPARSHMLLKIGVTQTFPSGIRAAAGKGALESSRSSRSSRDRASARPVDSQP